MGKISFPDFWKYYDQNNVNQKEAICLLESAMPQSLLTDEADWVVKYREPEPKPDLSNPLPVEYMWQRDNYDGEGDRECQTSSIAMALKFLGVPGINSDDDYLRIVNQYGDTTQQATHMQALDHLGVQASFCQTLHKEDIIKQIEAGVPVPLGYLHHGDLGHPTGGHYLCAVGFTQLHLVAHDPFGNMSMVTGYWEATGPEDGKFIHYSWKNFLKRWDVGGGWGWIFDPAKK